MPHADDNSDNISPQRSTQTQLTRFPKLCPSQTLNSRVESTQKSFSLSDLLVSREVIILSWAILLRCYTEELKPVFLVDEDVVEVDLPSNTISIKQIGSMAGLYTTKDNTRICFGSRAQKRQGVALEFLYIAGKRLGVLRGSGTFSDDFLGQIYRQLREIIRHKEIKNDDHVAWHTALDLPLSILNPYPKYLDGAELLHQLFAKHASKDATALDYLCPDGRWQSFSYTMVDRLSTRLASKLQNVLTRSEGTRRTKSRIIPILVSHNPALYIAILAILKAGAAFCPLNSDAPKDRIRFVVQDVDAPLIITTTAHQAQFSWEHSPEIVLCDNLEHVGSGQEAVLNTHTTGECLAYMMYTSGSTGKPKGVGISHTAVCQALLAHDQCIPPFQRFLQFAAPTFDVFVFELFFPLFRGSTVVSCDRRELLSDLPGNINRLNVDAVELTPTVVSGLLQKRASVPRLKLLLTIGEKLTTPIVNEFGGSLQQDGILYAMYGPTEATIHCVLTRKMQKSSNAGIIGIPLSTVSSFIIEPRLSADTGADMFKILPVGHVGELAIGGHQLADCYHKRPEQTAQAFINTTQYGPIYRTGDKARQLPGGDLEYLGRLVSGQVKLRGQRLELGEVESVLGGARDVANATAMIIDDVLVAFCFTQTRNVQRDEILDRCRLWLPAYMVPGEIVILLDAPRLSSGKIDKKKLETDYLSTIGSGSSDHVSTADELEQNIRTIACELLGTRFSNFNSLAAAGLDSLLAIRFATRLQEFGICVGAVDVLNSGRLEDISALARESQIAAAESPQSTGAECHDDYLSFHHLSMSQIEGMVKPTNVDDIIPCTPVQTAMLAETALNAQAYCNWIEVKLPNAVKSSGVQDAFKRMARENEILRSGFVFLGAPAATYAQIIWVELSASQFQIVSEFDYSFALNDAESLFRPLRIQTAHVNGRLHLLVQIHHALYDGWSWEHMLNDLELLLSGHSLARRPQYREVVNHFLRASKPVGKHPSVEFWTKQLNGLTSLPIPNFHGQNDVEPGLGTACRRLKVTKLELDSISRRISVTPIAFFQATLAYLLSLYLGSPDVVFGTVSSGRTLPINGIEHIMGPCITTLPTRLDVSCSNTVQELVQSAHKHSRESLAHSAIPLREIKKACGFDSDRRLFDALIIWQQTTRPISDTSRLIEEVNRADLLEYNLTIEIEPGSASLSLRANFQRALFPQAQINLLLSQIDQIVECMVLSTAGNLKGLSPCLDERSLSIENLQVRHRDDEETLTSSLERIAFHDPQRTAIEFAKHITGEKADLETLSYKQLNEKSNQLAHFLLNQQQVVDDLVCICLDKSVELYIAIIATIKAGFGYLPVTPETPQERIVHTLTEAKVKICLTASNVQGIIRDLNTVDFFDVDRLDLTLYPITNLNIKHEGLSLAYAVFTSGSTGTPKGVLVTRENLLSNLTVLKTLYPVSIKSRLLQSCSQAFDVSVFEIFFVWHSGISLCSTSNDVLYRDIEHVIRTLRVTHLSLTPTVAALVDPSNVPRVEFLVTAGEGVTSKVFQKWSGKGLYQGYGPSETTNICTVKPQVQHADAINNIGPPLSNTSAFVASDDEDFIVLPRGAVGEFCFGGDQVCRGYLNMPDLTKSKFLNHPQYGRIYRSGDYGRLLTDGSLSILGRKDGQVKIRGQRIELGEVNSKLLQHPAVNDCATLVVKTSQTGSEQLVSFWVPTSQRGAAYNVISANSSTLETNNKIKNRLISCLPGYMIPFALVPVTCLPFTPQSKIDSRRLMRSFQDLSDDDRDLLCGGAPDTEGQEHLSKDEAEIAHAVASVVDIHRADVRRQTSFYSLGIDSISAIALSKALSAAGYGDVGVSTILRYSTVGSLSRRISTMRGPHLPAGSVTTDLPSFFADWYLDKVKKDLKSRGKEIQAVLPCTPLQEAMLSVMNSADSAYYNHLVFSVYGDIARLRSCWENLVSRHGMMRTFFRITVDQRYAYAQIVLAQHQPAWAVIETTPERRGEVIKELTEGKPRSIQDFEPPYAFTVVTTSDDCVLILSMHHALYDGGAMCVILEEIESTYSMQSLPSTLPFDRFLAHMDAVDLTEADRFWKDHLQLFEPMPFPNITGKSSSVRAMLQGTSWTRFTSTNSLRRIENGCKSLAISLLSLCQSAWVRLLSTYLGERDICFGNVVSGRTVPLRDVQRTVGPCFNTLPVRVQLNPEMTNLALMEKLQLINANSLPFQLTPLRRIQSKHSRGNERLFDTLFILQQPPRKLDGRIWSLDEDLGAMDFPIICELIPNHETNTLNFTLHFYRSVLSELDADLILRTLDATLQSCLDYSSGSIGDYKFLDREFLSVANGDLTCSPAPQKYLHSGFEENAQLSPETHALDFLHFDGRRTIWTFKQLNQLSNQIAHLLILQGVQHDQAVPICMPKCPEFYASILAVLKAGAAFTPMDPHAPRDRKQYMLDELQANVLISNHTVDVSWSKTWVLNVDKPNAFKDASMENPPLSQRSVTNLAYRLYTSGSTGRPKAVSVEHSSAVRTIAESKRVLPWTSESRILQYAATTFDMCYFDSFLAWTFGFCLSAAPQSALTNDLRMIINTLEVTMLDLTPTVASTLTKGSVPKVNLLYCIGEAMPQQLADSWAGKCVNSYGPTEAAMCCTIHSVSQEIKSSIIGRPFPSTSFTVKAEGGTSSLPRLGKGELIIGGAQVARGYHANESLTQENFAINENAQRIYKSGDLVRMLSNGLFEYLGRKDDQVKIRGLRVELAEINNVIKDGHHLISDVSTQVLKYSSRSHEQLVAFLVVPNQENNEIRLDLKKVARSVAEKKLPSYMIPQIYILLQKLPLSTAGKLDKRALAEVFRTTQAENLEDIRGVSHAVTAQASSKDETQILTVFSSLSGIDQRKIGLDMTIYELGFDSISAGQIAAQLRSNGIDVSAVDIIEQPTVSRLATLVLERGTHTDQKMPKFDFAAFDEQHRMSICKSQKIRSHDLQAVRPCTPVQAGMIAQFLHSNGSMYFNSITIRLDSEVDISRLKEAWKAVTAKFQMLRTGFTNINDINHAFAMLTYHSSAVETPWLDIPGPQSSSSSSGLHQYDPAADVLRSLHLPTWRLLSTEHGSFRYLRFSALHAIYDAQALQYILADVASCYHGNCIASEMPLESAIGLILDASISDTEPHIAFWRTYSGNVHIKKFPNMAPLRVVDTIKQVLSRTCSHKRTHLDTLCRQRAVTMQAAGQAAWARILSAYHGDAFVTFGLVSSGRNMSTSAEGAVFPCITTLPMSCQIEGTNRDLLQRIMSSTKALMKHQFTPLTKIQRIMGHPNEALFDSIFAYQKTMTSKDDLRPWKEVHEEATVDYAVSIELFPVGEDGLQFRVTFVEDLLPRAQAEIMLSQLECALFDTISVPQAACADSSRFNGELLSIIPPKEPTLASEVELLHQFVELKSQQAPHKLAFEFVSSLHDKSLAKEQWSYHQLNAEGNKIAHLLKNRGVTTGDLIAVCFDKCPQAFFAILGILKAGCAYVAIDPAAPVARQTFILEDSQSKLVLSMKDQANTLKVHTHLPILSLDDITNIEIMPSESPSLTSAVRPSNTCYCLYTSGTTGTPKGCEVTHENAVQAMLSFQRLFKGHWDDESRWLQFASFHFDVSVLEQYWSWSVGICVTSAPRDLIFQDLAGTIQQLNITHLDLTPSLAGTLHPDDVPSLCRGVFITGGEQLKQEIIDLWGVKEVIYNGYGPTEATIGCTMFPRVPKNGKPSNIGSQFDNVGTYVLHPGTSIPVVRGGVGELCISGKLVSRGYLHRPKLTMEKFQTLSRFDERIYRTGDLVRTLHDNTFDFLGRADDQIKLRGQRLETSEIDVVVKSATQDVQDCATLALQHPKQLKEQLVSFLVSHTSSGPKGRKLVEAVRAECRRKLPVYMIPTHFVLRASMPLSANNKADAKQLAAIYKGMTLDELRGSDAVPGNRTTAEWSTDEKSIANVLLTKFSLPCELEEKRSSFFELGLDSITVISFARFLREAGFSGAQTSIVVNNPTIENLAQVLRDPEDNGASMRRLGLGVQQRIAAFVHRHAFSILKGLKVSQDAVESIVPCTSLQEGMLSRSLTGDTPIYFGAFLFEVAPTVEVARLKRAWMRVVANVQVLRTRFVLTPEGYAQVVMKDTETPWSELDVLAGAEIKHAKNRYLQWWSDSPDPADKPFELIIIRSPAKTVMCVHMFHAIYDGVSLSLVMDKLALEYREASAIDYGPLFHQTLLSGPFHHANGAETFWTEHLARSLPGKMPSLVQELMACDSVATLVVNEFRELESVRRNLNATHQTIVQACWIAVLQKFFSASVTLGMVVSGRSIDVDGVELTIGPLFNTIPFCVVLNREETWRSLVEKCQQYNTTALPYQHTPLRDITRWCKRSSADPLFDTLFVFQKSPTDLATASQDLWAPLDFDFHADYPLAFEAEQQLNGGLKMTIVAQGGISSTKTSLSLLEAVKSNILQMLADPETLIDNAPATQPYMKNSDSSNTSSAASMSKRTESLPTHFRWSEKAYAIREEFANLANVSKDAISEYSSIFELGLDSIDAIKLISRLKRRDIRLSVSTLMRLPTIAGLMEHLSLTPATSVSTENQIDLTCYRGKLRDYLRQKDNSVEDIENILPVTPLQEAMVAEMVQSDYTRYFNHDILKLMPSVDHKRLKHAWKTVVEKSPILRTTFAEIEDPDFSSTYCQIIHQLHDLHWTQVSITRLEDINDIIRRVRQEVALSAYKVNGRPPLMLTLVECPKETYLLLSIAHALYDGWSLGLLHEDLQCAYYGHYLGRPLYLDMLQEIVNASGPDAAEYWKNVISGVDVQFFPQRRGAERCLSKVVHRKEKTSFASIEDIRSFCKAQGVTVQALGQTCWACMLAHRLKTLDVVFGSVLSGRNTEEANEILFPAMNTVAIRSILHGTRGEMVRYMQNLSVDLIPHQHYPLRRVQALSNSPGEKLFDTIFIYQKRPKQQLSEERKLYESIGSTSEVDYPICIEMEQIGDFLVWRAACHDSKLGSSSTTKLLDDLDSVLSSFVNTPDAEVLDFWSQEVSICDLPAIEHMSQEGVQKGFKGNTVNDERISRYWSPTELVIRRVLSDVSKIPEDDIRQDMTIFNLGLDSISAIKVSSLLRKRSVKLAVSDMQRAVTIRNLARVIDERPLNEADIAIDTIAVLSKATDGIDFMALTSSSGIDEGNIDRSVPATAGQVYMLSVWQTSKGTLFYPTFNYNVHGQLDRERLNEAWQNVISEIPILRTSFIATGSLTVPILQVVFKSVSNSIIWIGARERNDFIECKKFDFTSPAVTLYAHQSIAETHLHLQIHHALYDGVSLPKITRRLEELYNYGKTQAAVSSVFTEFVAMDYQHAFGGQRKRFWTGYLPTTDSLLSTAAIVEPVGRVEVFLPNAVGNLNTLECLARIQGISIQTFFLAAFSKIHASIVTKLDGRDSKRDTVFGIYLANRSHHLEGLPTLAAPTVNIVPLRVKSPLLLPMIDIAQNIQQDLQVIGRLENSGVALWEIAQWTGIRIDCFVNFLKLPDHDEDRTRVRGTDKGIIIEELKDEPDNGFKRVVNEELNGYSEPRPLAANLVKDTYLPSLDVEATIRNGSLNIGVFCPENILRLEEASDFINEISKTLEALSASILEHDH